MGQFYREGEQKVRPGIYQRYSNRGKTGITAMDGVVAFVMRASWGPVDTVTEHANLESVKETYGTGEGPAAAEELFKGGASNVYIYRPSGTGGKQASVTIGEKLTVTARYPGDYSLKIKVQEPLTDATKKQLLVASGTTILETHVVAAGETEASLLAKIVTRDSQYVTAEAVSDGAVAAAEAELAEGADGTVSIEDYTEAFYALEPYRYNVLCTDSMAEELTAVMQEYLGESEQNGKLRIGVIGADAETSFTERLKKAKAMNSELFVFVGNGYVDAAGNRKEGVPAIVYTAGLIAATKSNQSIVHSIIDEAIDVTESFTDNQYIKAIESGLLLLSVGADGEVWYDSGINTLTEPAENQDEGWKKIKRTKVRIELMDRMDRVLSRKVGTVDCMSDGIADVLQAGNGVLLAMSDERKIAKGSGRMYEDPDLPATSDSAWFIIEADDVDTLEKMYLHYQYRYSQNA